MDQHTVHGRNQRRHNLNDEFKLGGQRRDIVHHAQHNDDNSPQQNAAELVRHVHKQQNADDETQKNSQSPQPGDGDMVHPAVILGDIYRPHLISKRLHDGGR